MAGKLSDAIDKFYRVYNEQNLDLWDEALSDDYVGHVNGHDIPSREAGKGFVEGLIQAFPDIEYTVEDTITQGSKVVCRWKATGTHSGVLSGMPPTNKNVTMLGISIFRVEGGKIAELWNIWDQHGLMQQLSGQ